MLVNSKQILNDAHINNYAIGAFNVNNMEILQAVIDAAEEKRAPVIIQTSEGAIKYAGMDYLAVMVKLAAEKAAVPVVLHLDHGTSYDVIMNCISHGWTSVMIDSSNLDLEKNIIATKEIVKVAHACGVSVEAELGRLSGVEDNVSVSDKEAIYTSPKEAEIFVRETQVDSLAIAIGTAHGKYKGVPNLDFDRLNIIKNLVKIPIVLHGASGISEQDLRKAVKFGANKINIDTDIRQAFTDGCKQVFADYPDIFDPRKICGNARVFMKKVVENKIDIFGCSNRA